MSHKFLPDVNFTGFSIGLRASSTSLPMKGERGVAQLVVKAALLRALILLQDVKAVLLLRRAKMKAVSRSA